MQRINLVGQLQMEKRLSVKSSLAPSPTKGTSPDKQSRCQVIAEEDRLSMSMTSSAIKVTPMKASPARDQQNRSLFKRGRVWHA